MKLAELFAINEATNGPQYQDKYDQIIWKMDRWMPDERELQKEYNDIPDNDVDAMAEFLEMNGDEEILRKHGFNGNYKLLARAAFRSR